MLPHASTPFPGTHSQIASRRLSAAVFIGAMLSALLVAIPITAEASGMSSTFVAVPHARIMNTQSTGGTVFGPGETRNISVLGVAGVPVSGVEAVVLDVAVSTASATPTYVQAWTTGTPRPSNGVVHVGSAGWLSNTIIVAPDDLGSISLYNGAGSANMNVDIQGYFTAGSNGGFTSDRRALLANYQDRLGNGDVRNTQVTGGTVPATATAIFANVTVVDPTYSGNLMFTNRGTSSSIAGVTYSIPGTDTASIVIPLDADGGFALTNSTSSTGTAGVYIEMQGYFEPTTSGEGSFTVVPQQLVLASSNGVVELAAGATLDVAIGGTNGMPVYGVESALLNVTAGNWSASGGIAVYPKGSSYAGAPIVQFSGTNNSAIATSTTIPPGLDGKITIRNTSTKPVAVKLVLEGWFSGHRAIAASSEEAFVSNAVSLGVPQGVARLAVWDQAIAELLPNSVEVTEDVTADGSITMSPDSPEDESASVPSPPADAANLTVTEAPADETQEPTTYLPRDAGDGTCAAGYRLYAGHETVKVKSVVGVHIYTVGLKKRWCAKKSIGRIGTTWARQWGDVTAVADTFIEDKGTNPDQNFEDKFMRADGVHIRSGHLTTRMRTFRQCYAGRLLLCFDTHYGQSFSSFWNGSRQSWTYKYS